MQDAERRAVNKMTGWETFSLTPLRGGANNRCFRVDGPDGPHFLKVYFRHPGDRRDRLGHEWAFSRYAQTLGLASAPRPLAKDDQEGAAMYEFIEGDHISKTGPEEVEQALDFFLALNRDAGDAASLSVAAESCFTVEEHFRLVEGRVERLRGVSGAAEAFVEKELLPAWEKVKGARPDLPEEGQRCVSPSDFGFHNALRRPDGRLVFFDFEYAGWDDPARMVCDFFTQVQVPVPMEFFDPFAEAAGCRTRAEALLPLYRIKWCCILLNPFLEVGTARREFADPALADAAARAQQLDKARALLSNFQRSS